MRKIIHFHFGWSCHFIRGPNGRLLLRREIKRFIRENVLIPRIRDRIKPSKRDKINATTRLNLTAASSPFLLPSLSLLTTPLFLFASLSSPRRVKINTLFCRLTRLCVRFLSVASFRSMTFCLSCYLRLYFANIVLFFSSTGLDWPQAQCFVRPFITKVVNTIFRKRVNRFWCTLTYVFHPPGTGIKRSTSEVRRLRVKVTWGPS